jgi:YbgC/YbaW family acyl-CoA thioester hydrolase
MACEYKVVREVEFHHTDMAGIVHFSNFYRFMEAVEHAFFRSIGFTIHSSDPDQFTWPRVHASCDFSYPLRFEDIVEIHLLVKEKREKSLVYTIIFRKLNGEAKREVARGKLVVACVKRDGVTGKMKAVPIPKTIADKIDVAPPEAPDA